MFSPILNLSGGLKVFKTDQEEVEDDSPPHTHTILDDHQPAKVQKNISCIHDLLNTNYQMSVQIADSLNILKITMHDNICNNWPGY